MKKKFFRVLNITISTLILLFIIVTLIFILIITITYQKLPELHMLTNYHPKIPLRIFSAEGVLIGEFGEEKRNIVNFIDVPEIMKNAILAIEDDRFYHHSGVDYKSILRAAFANLSGKHGGGSTITQQVARNFFLTSNEPTFLQKVSRKFFYEIPLAWKIEKNLTKNQILDIYINHIYLGQRAYGFASAAKIYFGKTLKKLSIAEAAMLAGLPKAPSIYNPIVNLKRANTRQKYILERMYQLQYITNKQYQCAKNETLHIKHNYSAFKIHAEYVSEMVRQLVYAQFKESTYTRGLNVFTTIKEIDQNAAYTALQNGILHYEKNHNYRGPEGYIEIPILESNSRIKNIIQAKLLSYPNNNNLIAAVVLKVSKAEITAVTAAGQEIKIFDIGLQSAGKLLHENTPKNQRIKRGTIIRVFQDKKNWMITQIPQVQSAFISINPHNGAILSLVGGFDFNQNKFNHVTQAWRQPGSSFKPFIYSSALEKGLSPATIINDVPLKFIQKNGHIWQPKNYGGTFEGPVSIRYALQKSINLVSVQILEKVGIQYAQQYLTRFGFNTNKHPPYLTLALGAGTVTPLQMVRAYSIFANGGYKINPYLISKITDNTGNTLLKANPIQSGDEANRVIDIRNAFLVDSMLRDVIYRGTAIKATALKRIDLAGKTGTTNNAMDAWFAGYQPNLVAMSWMGYDHPKSLGEYETGGKLALPIWINYMKKALKNVPMTEEHIIPNGLIKNQDDYSYAEYVQNVNTRNIK